MNNRKIIILVCILLVTFAPLFGGGRPQASSDKIVLNYVTWMTQGEDKPWIDAFMAENPDIEVRMEMLEGGRYEELMRTRILSGDIPDVMLIMSTQVQDYSREGYLADLSGTPGAQRMANSSAALNFATRDGKLQAYSVSAALVGYFWYNKVLFRELGLQAPRTMDEFWMVNEALKRAGKDPILLGGADTWTYNQLQLASWTHLASAALSGSGLSDVNEALYNGATVDSIYRANFEFVKRLVDNEYLVRASLTTTWPQSAQIFVDGNVGMFPQGPWVANLPEVRSADPSKFELGVFALPLEDQNGRRYVRADFQRWLAVSSRTRHSEAAMRLFNFITREDQMVGYLERLGLTTLLGFNYNLPPQIIEFRNFVSGPNYTQVSATFPQPPGWIGEVPTAMKNIQAGATVNRALSDLQAFYNDNRDQIRF